MNPRAVHSSFAKEKDLLGHDLTVFCRAACIEPTFF